MKILFITDLYPVKNIEKTTPRTLKTFVTEWENAGHEVDVIKPNFILNSFLRGKPFYKSGKYGNVLNLNFWTPFWKVTHSPTPSPLKGEGDDLIIAHMPSGILFADKLGLPFVAGVHNSDLTVLTNKKYKFYFKKRLENALENAKAIACRSLVLKDKLLKLYPQFAPKTFTAPSGINQSIITKRSITQTLKDSMVRVLICANYKKSKNIEKVLEAVKDLEGFKLTVIGEGTNTNKLRKLNPKAIFKGYQPHEKVLEEMRNSDIFILPSTGETFGMVYLEAMSQGCITVCTKGDGIDGIIRHNENGFLTHPKVSHIKETLSNIKNLPLESLKTLHENSFKTVNQYTQEQCAENYLQQIFKFL